MNRPFSNVYADRARADAYATLDFPGTYWLAFRDLPELFARHVRGRRALDFGCGTGRSTRFLRDRGFEVTGADVAEAMVVRAREADPAGDYRLIHDGDAGAFADERFDLILCAFTFDNVPTFAHKAALFRGLRAALAPGGRIVNLVSDAEIYLHEWASFSTKDFPENRRAGTGDVVRIVMLDVEDRRPVEDVLWPEPAWMEVYAEAGLSVVAVHHPFGSTADPWPWVSETEVSPWAIYVLAAGEGEQAGGR
jgi:SAM-dependent methyltransferase